MTTVVAGVIKREQRVLICQRKLDSWHAGKWEFPGGKVEPGEAPDAALARELREELGIRAVVSGELVRYEYEYPGRDPILLIFFRAQTADEPRNLDFESICWEQPSQLQRYDFLEGDLDFVARLAAGTL